MQNVNNNLSITDGTWKYIPAANGPAISKQTNTELGNRPNNHQLYYLVSDPGEHKNVYNNNKEKAEQLRSELIHEIERGDHYKGLKEVKTEE